LEFTGLPEKAVQVYGIAGADKAAAVQVRAGAGNGDEGTAYTQTRADDRALQQRISSLREKIEKSGYIIATVRGEGYRFERKP